jgi:ATP adenylyltransferase
MAKRKPASPSRGTPKRPRRAVLHAPWRLEYILGPREQGCFFCDAERLADGDLGAWRRSLLVYRDAHVMVILNRYPYTGGHLLIAPRRHTADFPRLTQKESERMWELSRRAIRILEEAFHPHGFNLGMNLGRAGGAGVEEHLHLHALPRWHGDTNFMPVIAGTHSLPVSLEALWDQLHPRFNSE